jgi:hypothetical protein
LYPEDHALSTAEEAAQIEAEKKVDDYEQKEAGVKQQIFNTIYDSLLIRVQKHTKASDVWDAILKEMEGKSEMVKVDLQRQMLEKQCSEEADVKTHLETLQRMQEELAGMGAPLSDSNFTTTILTSLPKSYGLLLSSVTALAKIVKTTLTLDFIIGHVLEEYNRRTVEARQAGTEENTAMASRSYEHHGGDRHSGGQTDTAYRPDVECYNCGKKGHIRRFCRAKGGGRYRRQGERGELANTTTASDKNHALTTTSVDEAALARISATPSELQEEVIDTGATCHMSPYRDSFNNFVSLLQQRILTADRRASSLSATGRGDLRIKVPNGNFETTLTLKNVLYCPNMLFTLISIGCIDNAGYAAKFYDRYCSIRD